MKPSHSLPCSLEADSARYHGTLDIILVSGDAFIDHPSFGTAVIARFLTQHGFTVGIIPQPDWRSGEDIKRLGRPKLFFGVSAGNLDSMVANYTAAGLFRHDDAYSPGGRGGKRPDRATIVYTNLIKQAFPQVPIILGGIEASLRRFAHYDFWSDSMRRSLLFDAKADLIVYGMGEGPVLEIARRLQNGESVATLRGIRGTARIIRAEEAKERPGLIALPSFEQIQTNPAQLIEATQLAEKAANPYKNQALLQPHGQRYLLAEPPIFPLASAQIDQIFSLPYTRRAHPAYTEAIPAALPISTSVITHRGCLGGCAFCTLALHQGKFIQSRSRENILAEIAQIQQNPGAKGIISDLGGPSANMYQLAGKNRALCQDCERISCLHPRLCPNLDPDPAAVLALLAAARQASGIRHVFVNSGIRMDLALEQGRYIETLAGQYVGGQLSTALEHVNPSVLHLMRKPSAEIFERFRQRFLHASSQAGKEQYLIPYLMVGFPGTGRPESLELKNFLKSRNIRVRQIQEFIPLPGTLASALYAAGEDGSHRPIYVERHKPAVRQQKDLLFWWEEDAPTPPKKKLNRRYGAEEDSR